MVAPVLPALHARLHPTQGDITPENLVRVPMREVRVGKAEGVTHGDGSKVQNLSFHAYIVARISPDAKHIHRKVIVLSPCPARVYVGAAAPAKMAGP